MLVLFVPPPTVLILGSILITYSSGLSSQAVGIFQSSCYCHHPWSQGPKWVVEKMARHTGSEATSVKLGKADCSSALAYRTVSRYSAFSELESMNTVVQELRNQEQCKRSASQTSAGFDGAYHRRRYPPAPSFGPLNLTFTLSSQEICPIPSLSPLVYQNNHHRSLRKWCVPCLSKPNFLLWYQVILVSTLQKTNFFVCKTCTKYKYLDAPPAAHLFVYKICLAWCF